MSLPQNQHRSKTNRQEAAASSRLTRCGVITGVGRSAVAVVAVQGPDAVQVVLRCFRAASPAELSPGQVRYGHWAGANDTSDAVESVVVTPLSPDAIEVHCHGGPAATERILSDLQACGAIAEESGHWIERETPLLIVEAKQVLAACLTRRTAAIALDQVRGAMQGWASNWLRAINESDPEYSREAFQRDVQSLLRVASLGLRLTEPFRIVLLGPPNVGKSSLLNAIVGYDRSITHDLAGTTRDVLHAETVIDGWPVRLSDTAGIRETLEPIEREGVVRATTAAGQADLLICVAEPALLESSPDGKPFLPERSTPDWPAIAASLDRVRQIRVMNKADLWKRSSCMLDRSSDGKRGPANLPELDPELDPESNLESGLRSDFEFDLLTNALTGEGLTELMAMISARLVQFVPPPGSPVPVSQRQVDCLRAMLKAETSQHVVDALHALLGPRSVWEEP